MKKILAAIDGSDHAWKALDFAADFAKQRNAELIILHVVPYEPLPQALRDLARIEHIPVEEENVRYHYSRSLGDKLTQQAEERARGAGVQRVTGRLVEGLPTEGILATAKDEAVDVIVLGCRGFSSLKGLLVGSVSHKVTQHAPCTCVTVR